MTVCIIDTSVFCEMLRVPGRSQRPEEIIGELESKLSADEILLLPIATIVETGNHIGRIPYATCSRQILVPRPNQLRYR